MRALTLWSLPPVCQCQAALQRAQHHSRIEPETTRNCAKSALSFSEVLTCASNSASLHSRRRAWREHVLAERRTLVVFGVRRDGHWSDDLDGREDRVSGFYDSSDELLGIGRPDGPSRVARFPPALVCALLQPRGYLLVVRGVLHKLRLHFDLRPEALTPLPGQHTCAHGGRSRSCYKTMTPRGPS